MFFRGDSYLVGADEYETGAPLVELKCGPIHRTAFPVVDDALNRFTRKNDFGGQSVHKGKAG